MKQLLAILILIPFSFSCSNKNEEIAAGDCPPKLACTEVNISIMITIKDQQGRPYRLDEYYTTKVLTGQKIVVSNAADIEIHREYGAYPVLADRNKGNVTKAGEDFEFTGKKNGKVVITKTFTIGHDCCHIELIKGEREVVIPD